MRRILSALLAGLGFTLAVATPVAGAAPTTAASVRAHPATYDVIVGSFVDPANAMRRVAALNQKGFPGFTISRVQVRGRTFHRVLRSYPTKATADLVSIALRRAGLETWVARR